MRIQFTQSTRKHRISKGRALEVIEAVEAVVTMGADGVERWAWLGCDGRGVELEIYALITTDEKTGEELLLVIHVMPTHYRKKVERE